MKKLFTLFGAFFLIVSLSFGQQETSKPIVIQATYFDVSPPLREMVKNLPDKADRTWKDGVVKNMLHHERFRSADTDDPRASDPMVQSWNGPRETDSVEQSFDGVGNTMGLCPPDTDGDVGPGYYFQEVNCKYAIYTKTGTLVLGPLNNSSIFSGMPNNSNDGDGIVLYDEEADRWLFSQFSLPNYPSGPFYEMVAISTTGDPTGSWYRYQFQFSDMPDYPKIGIWPDGYYMTMNRFSANSLNYVGTGAVAMNRTKMLAGDPTANMVTFSLNAANEAYAVLPADCDGTFPPVGTPNYFTYLNDGPDRLGMYAFHVDWTNPSASTYQQHALLNVSAFNGNITGGIVQKGTSVKLDALSGRLMFRLQFRTFEDHFSMVACGTVNVGSNKAGIRWFELRKTGTDAWSIYQQGTYAPDAHSRWMGSIAMNPAGDIALGYSISSSTKFPSVYYTGRLAGDPLNEMTVQEGVIKEGLGSQTNTWSGTPSRWGDYSAMNVDPSDPSKFWYTQEYYQSTNQSNWKTRIGCFTLNAATTFSLTGVVTYPGTTPTPLAGITLNLKNNEGSVIATTTTSASGSYSFGGLINGNYTLEPASAKPWGGVTALDVLLYRKHIGNIAFLEGIFLASGDVNASGSLTAADVLLIKKRIGGVTNSFTVGDWLFNNTPVTINGANTSLNFNGLCYGDANASYVPSGKGNGTQEVTKAASGALTISTIDPAEGEVVIPVYANDLQNMGSFQFSISYDPSKLTFTGADTWYEGIDNVLTGIPAPGQLTFVWAADLKGITVNDKPLCHLHFMTKTTGPVSVIWNTFPTPMEFSDYDGNLFTPALLNGGIGNVMSMENLSQDALLVYPNPVKDYLILRSMENMVGVKVYTTSGKQVLEQTLNGKESRISTTSLATGIYVVRVDTKAGTINRSILIEK